MYSNQALRRIIRTTLELIYLYSPAAEDLLLGTAATESHLGKYTSQQGGGPALGIYQMEPATLYDIWDSWLAHRPWLRDEIAKVIGCGEANTTRLQYDPIYATVMARLHYRRVKWPLPKHGDVVGYAEYWKAHYNTPKGKGTEIKFIADWRRLVDVPEEAYV